MANNTLILDSFDCSSKLQLPFGNINRETPYCTAVHDGILCWPETPSGYTIAQHCPTIPGFDKEMLVYRKCNENGIWHSFTESFVVIEKTNYESCLKSPTTLPPLFGPDYLTQITTVIRTTNILGMVFVLLSILSIAISIILYKSVLPKYINDILRVKIHKHLFAAVALDMILKLIFQVSVLLAVNDSAVWLLQKPILCEVLITINQYSETTILLWIVVDCHFIHTSASSGFLVISGYLAYILIGWGTPLVPTLIWAITLIMSHKESCWHGHVNLSSIWIVEIPKILCFVAIVILMSMSSYKHYQKVLQRVNHDSKTVSDVTTTGILFLLMLATYLITIIPTNIHVEDFQSKIAIQCVATILTSSKGIYVTVLCNYSNIKDYVRAETSNSEDTDIEI